MKIETQVGNNETGSALHEQLYGELMQLKKDNAVAERMITTATGREIYIAVLNPQKAFSEVTAIVGEAHADDAILGEGINIIASDIGVGVTYVTMTDGSARELDGYDTPKELALQRRIENVEAAKKAGAAMVINFGYRDSELQHHKAEATKELQAVIDSIQPQVMFAPNKRDTHNDHAAGYAIARKAIRGKKVSLYGTDTQTMKGRWGFSLRPTHYFEVSQEIKSRREQEYDSHISQVAISDRRDVDEVIAMPEVRGKQRDWKYGGVLFKAMFSKDRLTPLLRQNEIQVTKRSLPQVIFQGAKQKSMK